MFFDILLSVLALAGVLFLLRVLVGSLLLPIRSDRCRMRLSVSVKGHVPNLEYILRGARWLAQESGAELCLIDEGMDVSTTHCALKLAASMHFSVLKGEVNKHEEQRDR